MVIMKIVYMYIVYILYLPSTYNLYNKPGIKKNENQNHRSLIENKLTNRVIQMSTKEKYIIPSTYYLYYNCILREIGKKG